MPYSCATKERAARRRRIASGDGPRLETRRVSLLAAAFLASWCADCFAQNLPVPYEETFDAAVPPALPAGWRSSTARSSGSSDFTCVTTSPNSPPCAVMATNATIEQWLVTPSIDCRTGTPDRLTFAVRRSSTFGARCLVEASLDGGVTFSLTIGEAPGPGSSASYVPEELPLPEMLAGQAAVVLRWRIIAESTGATGTFRMDDVRISVARPEISPGTVVVNELQYQPSSGEPEWVELFNAGAEPIDLKGWTVSDASVTTSHRLSDIPRVIPPAGFVVVAADSVEFRAVWSGVPVIILQSDGFPSLNNGGDLVLLRDAQGRCMDSVWYQQSWGGGMGVSIERIDPISSMQSLRNWGSCRDSSGATPGRTNSIVIRDH
ncbi:MAG TPA: lamin tail domain-containing protein, partial [Bacteroidota bacterium]|nr:lamin tail domain-containing protein [Bacteroidota bacterium]